MFTIGLIARETYIILFTTSYDLNDIIYVCFLKKNRFGIN